MRRVEIKESVLDDVLALETNLRLDDINEVTATGSNPHRSLLLGLLYSDICNSVVVNNEVIGMFGVCGRGLPAGLATIWCLGSPEIERYPIAFIKIGRDFFNNCLKKYNRVFNFVDTRNVKHLDWLKHIGVTFKDKVRINEVDFIQFIKDRGVDINV